MYSNGVVLRSCVHVIVTYIDPEAYCMTAGFSVMTAFTTEGRRLDVGRGRAVKMHQKQSDHPRVYRRYACCSVRKLSGNGANLFKLQGYRRDWRMKLGADTGLP